MKNTTNTLVNIAKSSNPELYELSSFGPFLKLSIQVLNTFLTNVNGAPLEAKPHARSARSFWFPLSTLVRTIPSTFHVGASVCCAYSLMGIRVGIRIRNDSSL